MRKVALLVGVERYRDPRIAPLLFATADVLALDARLRDRCDFDEVRVLADTPGYDTPDLHNVVRALDETVAELDEDDLFLFCFSGHGIERDGRGYLLTTDSSEARPQLMSLSKDVLTDTLHGMRARRRILLFDACRNAPAVGKGATDNLMAGAVSRDMIAAAQSAPDIGVTTALLSACREGTRAFEWPKYGHGVFTHFLLEGLDRDMFDFRQLARHTIQRVQEFTSHAPGIPHPQTPWYQEFGAADALLLGGAGRQGGHEAIPSAQAQPSFPQRNPGRVVILEPPRLHVATRPAGARVWVDGRLSGQSPVSVELAAGEYTVRAEMDGFAPWERRIRFDGHGDAPLEVALVALPKDPQVGEVRTFAGIEMVWCPPGEFMMGSPDSDAAAYASERPQHLVRIAEGFWLGKYLVTQGLWEQVMGENLSSFKGPDRPVECVSWEDCQAFCRKLTQSGGGIFRLPSEGEWEYACRAGTTTSYSFGDDASRLREYAWYRDNSGNETAPVGKLKPNPWGLYDMHGNVSEWCQDRWHGDYAGAPADARAWEGSDSEYRMLRGGAWHDYPKGCRSAGRVFIPPNRGVYTFGFRLLRTL